MALFETALHSKLTGAAAFTAQFGTRHYAGRAPQNPTKPYCVTDIVGNPLGYTHDGADGTEEPTIQFTIVADSLAACKAGLRAIQAVIGVVRFTESGVTFAGMMQQNEVHRYDHQTQDWEVVADFRGLVTGVS